MHAVVYWLKRLYRQGPVFNHYQRMLARTAQLPVAALKDHQNHRLRKLVFHCYKEIPYYRALFNELRLKPEDIQTTEDLSRLPILTKQQVNDNFDRLIARNRRNLLDKAATTSGTTGSPARFIRDFQSINFEHAAVWRQWHLAKAARKRRITLRGEVVVPMSRSSPPFWRYNSADNELLMCGFHLSQANSRAYIDQILAFKPCILSSYPSNAFLLAHFFKYHGVHYQFDAVLTSSEELTPPVRQFIESVFQCRVYDWYGQAERVAAICHCKEDRYHIQEDYSIVELLPSGTDNVYEIIGTHLYNAVMPLLRYRTQDLAVLSPVEARCPCGSSFRTVQSIIGRRANHLLTPEGYHISAANHIFHGATNILEGQFYQEHINELVIRVVAKDGFTDTDRQVLLQQARENISPAMHIRIEEVPVIPRGPNGKFMSIVNLLDTGCS